MIDAGSPDERRRRRLAASCRWLRAALDADPAVRDCIASLARSIDAGGPLADRIENLRLLDDLLTEEVGRHYRTRPDGDDHDR